MSDPAADPRHDPTRILVVDDDDAVRDVIGVLLREARGASGSGGGRSSDTMGRLGGEGLPML